jgi:hypothetical protein
LIYKRIAAKSRRTGWLPERFTLFENTTPGEADGVLLYGAGLSELSDENFEQLMALLKESCDNPIKKKCADLAKHIGENHILGQLDRLCEEIHKKTRGIDLIKLLDNAYIWATTSSDENMVKLGISIMGMLNLAGRGECRKAVVVLGKYEEFTLYSLYAVSGWKDAKKIMSAYAENLKGWGKAHAEFWLDIEKTIVSTDPSMIQ